MHILQVVLVDCIHGSLLSVTVLFKDRLDIFLHNHILLFGRSAFIVFGHSLGDVGHINVVIVNFLDFIVIISVLGGL